MTLISLVILPHGEILAPPNIKLIWDCAVFFRKEQMILLVK